MATNYKEATNSCSCILTPTMISKESSESTSSECCMCGDYGVSSELFQCEICQFRSQHSYCSSRYPRAESYKVCNWCHHRSQPKDHRQAKDGFTENSSNSNASSDDSSSKNRIRTTRTMRSHKLSIQRLVKKPITEQVSSPPPVASTPRTTFRKRIITNGALEEKRRLISKRTMSEEMCNNNLKMNSGIARKPAFRNKVRRYKHLDEVAS